VTGAKGSGWYYYTVVAFACSCLALSANAAGPSGSGVLHLTNNGYIPGRLSAGDKADVLRWQCPYFVRPLEFPLGMVQSVQQAMPASPPVPTGSYCFELTRDDVLYGELLGLNSEDAEVDVTHVGRVHLRRDQLARFYPCKGADLIYVGPRGMAGWRDVASTPQWREIGGQLATEQAGASIVGDFAIPPKAVIEFELSWRKKPDFLFAAGVSEKDVSAQHAFRFEVWDNDVVAVGESDRDADVASIGQVSSGAGHIRVQAYLDQEQGVLLLFPYNGKPPAALRVTAKKHPVNRALRLTNRKGDVRLEYLRISRWNGLPPRTVREDQTRLLRTDGTAVYARITAYDASAKQFTVRDGDKESVLKQDEIADVILAPSTKVKSPTIEAANDQPERTVCVMFHDGSRFSGRLTGIEESHLTLACPGIREPLRLPLAEVRALVTLAKQQAPPPPDLPGRAGRLEMAGLQIKGRLLDGDERPDASCLVWQPELALNASPIVPGASGRIVYNEVPVPSRTSAAAPRARPAAEVKIPVGFKEWLRGENNAAEPAKPAAQRKPTMQLRSGDTIPCEVSRIDDKGVTFKSPISEATFVGHEKLKSVELIPEPSAPRLGKARRERLLTLPRLQKDLPPTHLICARNGDVLRGRIVEMDDKRLQVEMHLETREIPRDRVAQIIWLHPEELTGTKAGQQVASAMRVQTVRAPADRLTFLAHKMEHGTLSGENEVLGPCRSQISTFDELLFGASIEDAASKLASQRWKLHDAQEPKAATADASGQPTGTESNLCGQPAFAVKLDLLTGQKFQLSEYRGRVVVLDFWATWCGPCMQTMPLVDEVARDFAGQGVALIAINMEEQPDTIKAMLQRHKLNVTVALDRDGVTAAKYGVTAIPETVVIDRDGKIARVFVGGGRGTADALRKALQELFAAKPAAAATPQPQ
jgi:thiol-disulfide isomerase/thioredoxin